VLRAAEETAAPVILQLSPGALAYAGYEPLTRLVFAAATDAAVEVAVHLDHCRDMAVIERALGDGFGSVMFDGSGLDDVANAAATALVARRAGEATVAGTNRRPAVEGELGVIGGSEDSTLESAVAGRASPERSAWFVEATGIDILAAAVGSLHRMPEDSVELDLDYLASVARAAGRPLALHGGSGVVRQQLPGAIARGVAKINISSRVGGALAAGIQAHWAERPGDRDLRRYLGRGRSAVAELAREYFTLSGSAGSSVKSGRTDIAIPSGEPLALEPE
jgi:ketose-bisphosphate aldolase